MTYREQERYEQAAPLVKRALEIRLRRLGPDHRDTARSREEYAQLLLETGRDPHPAHLETRAGAPK